MQKQAGERGEKPTFSCLFFYCLAEIIVLFTETIALLTKLW